MSTWCATVMAGVEVQPLSGRRATSAGWAFLQFCVFDSKATPDLQHGFAYKYKWIRVHKKHRHHHYHR